MTRADALRLLEETLELRPHTLKGDESLLQVEGWDSMSTMAFIAMADREFGLPLPGNQVAECRTVADLLGLLACNRGRPGGMTPFLGASAKQGANRVRSHPRHRVSPAPSSPHQPGAGGQVPRLDRRRRSRTRRGSSNGTWPAPRNVLPTWPLPPHKSYSPVAHAGRKTSTFSCFARNHPITSCRPPPAFSRIASAYRREPGALDFNLGCSGFVYGLGLAKGLIETGQAANVLLLTAETYSKFMHPDDRGVRAIFGDAAAATLVQGRPDAAPGNLPWIGPLVFGTDGKGMDKLIVAKGGKRGPSGTAKLRHPDHLHMNGPEIFAFTLRAVPQVVQELLERAEKTIDEIDVFVFHQANRYMLDHLRDKLKIPPDRFVIALSHCGNTVSSTIPIALKDAAGRGQLPPGCLVMLVGFGVGYSWGATLMRSSL